MITRRSLMAGAAALAMPLPSFAASKPLKVAFLYQAPRDYKGWTSKHEAARIKVQEHFGDKVETTYVENVAKATDAERVIRQLAQSGSDLIFTTSFSFMNPTVKVAEQFPDVKFESCTGYKLSANVATYAARYYEGRHVMGLISAA